MLWSLLLPLVPSRAADLPAVRASYNAIGGVFTPLWVAHEKSCSVEFVLKLKKNIQDLSEDPH
jgi:hypothetical protein